MLLLNIGMPGIVGTQVAAEVRKRKDKSEVIFLTTSDEFAVDAFALKATHYLAKPLPYSFNPFAKSLDLIEKPCPVPYL
ncbi:MAG: response regulator [Desulfosporosinus sp.]|nr:response regulator [Desulfosporosinus sp.]